MRLNELRIKRYDNWRNEPNKPDYVGTIELEGEKHKIQIKVSPELVQKIIELSAESVVECAKETAQIMTAEVIDSGRLLADSDE
jgi:hypothetical protein